MDKLLLVLLFLTSIFLIVLVLIQRGKGGGLAGALGGMGGQSAFGTKAGDLFTKITIGVAFFWIVICLSAGKLFAPSKSAFEKEFGGATAEQKDKPGKAAEKTPANDKTSANDKSPASTPEKKNDSNPAPKK